MAAPIAIEKGLFMMHLLWFCELRAIPGRTAPCWLLGFGNSLDARCNRAIREV
jgi:hypothetical protein